MQYSGNAIKLNLHEMNEIRIDRNCIINDVNKFRRSEFVHNGVLC
jgi:hypothetical protein